MTDDDPHADGPVVIRGPALADADAALVLVHGRGSTAEAIVGLADDLPTEGAAVLAPQAADDTWYPESFLAPLAANEPRWTSAPHAVDRCLDRAAAAGVPAERVVLAGFSQGACVVADYAAAEPRRYGGLGILSGGLMGETLGAYAGDLAGTPVLLACSDEDQYVPEARVHDSARAFETPGASVRVHVDEGGPHAVTAAAREGVAALLDGRRPP